MTSRSEFETGYDPQPELFSAVLTPHRSLSRAGFILLMSFIALVSFIGGLAFWFKGAWPVIGFFLLDTVLIYVAFRINFARAAAREEILVTPFELRMRRTSHRGHVVEWAFNPLWVRLDQEVDEEFGIEGLYLASHGQRVAIGSFLGPDEKASFAKALMAALQAAKRGPTYNPVN